MKLQTERLNIREISLNDIGHIHTLHSLPETDKFNTLGIPETIRVTENIVTEWLEKQNALPRLSYIFCLERRDSNQFIGLIGLNLKETKLRSAEVWFKILFAEWGKGFATEALKKILEFGFRELKLHRIEAGCAIDNSASAKVLEKAGMIKEGMKRKVLPIRGKWFDAFSYALLLEDFNSPISNTLQ
ncbi:MAG TPA: GNAT family protein [Puia sp.]